MTRFLRAPGSAEHRKVQGLLSAYLDGEVSPDERTLTERHLSQCEECARSLRSLKTTVRLLKGLPAVRPPRSFVLSRVPSQTPKSRLFSWGYALLQGATALAALLFVIVLSADIALQVGGSPRFQPSMPVAGELAPALSQKAPSPTVSPHLRPETAVSEAVLETEEEILLRQPEAEETSPPEEKALGIAERSFEIESGEDTEALPEVAAEELPPPEEAVKAEAGQEPLADVSQAVGGGGTEVPTATAFVTETPSMEAFEEAPLQAPPTAPSPPDKEMTGTEEVQEPARTPTDAKDNELAESPRSPEPPTERPSPEATEVAVVLDLEEEMAEPSPMQPAEEKPPPPLPSTNAQTPGLSRFLRWGEVGLLGLFALLLGATLFARRRRKRRQT